MYPENRRPDSASCSRSAASNQPRGEPSRHHRLSPRRGGWAPVAEAAGAARAHRPWKLKVEWLDPHAAKNGGQALGLAAGATDLIVINTSCIGHAASGRVSARRRRQARTFESTVAWRGLAAHVRTVGVRRAEVDGGYGARSCLAREGAPPGSALGFVRGARAGKRRR